MKIRQACKILGCCKSHIRKQWKADGMHFEYIAKGVNLGYLNYENLEIHLYKHKCRMAVWRLVRYRRPYVKAHQHEYENTFII